MPPFLALLIWLVLLLGLLYFDPAKESGTSLALWVPLIWIFFVGSRLPSQWFGSQLGIADRALEEGNPLDRVIFSILIMLAVGILISRSFNWFDFFTRNLALTAFLLFGLVSVLWSDFPFVAFKRWSRDLGTYLVVLVALSDSRPLEAVRTLLRRLCYLLIPLSIVVNKYFPNIGIQYDLWSGAPMFTGVATQKNMLGALCLVSGLFFFWDTVTRWSDRRLQPTKRIIKVNFAFLFMTIWLLYLASSATSSICLIVGCLVISLVHSGWGKRHPALLKMLIPASFCLYLILAFGFDINAKLAPAVGRNSTLTDRTLIWKILLNMHTNPIVGTGYDSFWLGSRLEWVARTYSYINESHNGYLEVYLNLGLIGLFLIVALLISSYRNICRKLTPFSNIASLSMALWTVALLFNMTEAAIRISLMWVVFLLAAIAVRAPAEDRVSSVAPFHNAGASGRFLRPSLKSVSQRR